MKNKSKLMGLFMAIILVFSMSNFPSVAGGEPPEALSEVTAFDRNAHGRVLESGDCGDRNSEVKYNLYEDGMLYIYGEGGMGDNLDVYKGWKTTILDLFVEDGVTSIGYNAFRECSRLKSAILPDSLESIKSYAFGYCSKLNDISLPSGLKRIESETFFSCSTLSDIKIPEGVVSIGAYAFSCCSNLEKVDLPESLEEIGESAFGLCPIKNISIPKSIKTIGKSAFLRNKFESVEIPENVDYIGDEAFRDCQSLKIVTLPKSLTSDGIGVNVFDGCTNLKIKGVRGSYAETYAKENGYRFLDIEENITFVQISDIVKGKVLHAKDEIEESTYSRYELVYHDKYNNQLKDTYSLPDSSIAIEEIEGVSEWEVSEVSVIYGLLSIDGIPSSGYYVKINLIDTSYKYLPTPAPTPTPTPAPTSAPVPTPTSAPTSAPTSTPSPTNPPLSDTAQKVQDFVSRMYTVALGRAAEEAGLNDWTNRLLSHEIDGAGIANGFIMSTEFRKRSLSNEEYVDTLYRTFFNRKADQGGRMNWLAKLDAGQSRSYVLAGFVNSSEFDQLCETYGIVRGTMQENGSPINAGIRQFVERCYTKVLGRPGEKEGLEDWTNRIATGQMSAENVAKSFFFSDEYMNMNTDDATFVETLYQTFMGRGSDPNGKNDWVRRLSTGTSRIEVLEGFSRSEEFNKILRSYGL